MNTGTIIICTKDELLAMHQRGEVEDSAYVITTEDLFGVLCEEYGVSQQWMPNDVY